MNRVLFLLAGLAWMTGLAAGQQSKPATSPVEDAGLQQALKGLDESMTREQIEALVKRANENRLKSERQLAAAEFKSQLADPDDIDAAVAVLEKDPKNTQSDNIERICGGCAKIDSKFAHVYKLYREKKYKEAVEAGRAIVVKPSTYMAAARAYIYARALEESNQAEDATDAYTDLVQNMYDRISFASDSLLRAAALQEKSGRGMRALQLYSAEVKAYGLTLEAEEFDKILAKVRKLQELYEDPLASAAKMMGDVKERLNYGDSSEKTRQEQEQIVSLLDDLIVTMQENESQNQGQGQGQKQGQQSGEKKEGQTSGMAQGQSPGRPSSPAKQSTLRLGEVERPGKLSNVHGGKENGDWSSLPPEQQEKLQQLRQRMVSERYRDIISDYRKRIAEEK